MWGTMFSIISAIPGLAEKFLDWNIKRANVDLEGFKTGAQVDLDGYRAYLTAQVEVSRIKLAAMSWWGAKAIILVAGLPAAVQFAAVMLDSTPLPFKTIGSWRVPLPPPPYDQWQKEIILSFFILAPAIPIVSAIARWLERKR